MWNDFSARHCARKAVTPSGYCKQHDPAILAKKRQAKQEEYQRACQERRDEIDRREKIFKAERWLIEKAISWRDGVAITSEVTEAIDKLREARRPGLPVATEVAR
ncbi:MAG TPA: hypothetical protein VGT24_01710 [Candidatus Acidoferrales bacterium]|nr:hypothetical protein [Candidatus Acidoferrales bacterium]